MPSIVLWSIITGELSFIHAFPHAMEPHMRPLPPSFMRSLVPWSLITREPSFIHTLPCVMEPLKHSIPPSLVCEHAIFHLHSITGQGHSVSVPPLRPTSHASILVLLSLPQNSTPFVYEHIVARGILSLCPVIKGMIFINCSFLVKHYFFKNCNFTHNKKLLCVYVLIGKS